MTTASDDTPSTPRTTSELLGHAAAERAFLDAWASGRLAHAWLICGPRGIGKATLAYRIARYVLSGGGGGGLFGDVPATLAIDPAHPVFQRVVSGGHADLKVVERGWTDDKKTRMKSEIPVDDVRGIGGFLSLTPAEGGWRVVIIDAVDELNRSGANAILKILEEPPRNALLLLVSHSPGRLLPTIRSRCRRLVMRPLPEDLVVDLLARHAPQLDAADARAIARLSLGSIGKALSLAGEGGLGLYRDMVGLIGGLPRLDIGALHAFSEKVAKSDDSFRTLSELFSGWLASAASQTGGERGSSEVLAGERDLQRRLVKTAGLDRWVEVWEKNNHLFGRADAVNLDRKLVVVNAFLALERLCRH
ncbi:DNA polymerase III subunit delta' [Telmatospirillum siberiense]|uniref:DNA polymerase III subunit delta n=1 Tax=Telmatospirillum siberiense TaxID=382514 RepID=A0A2N3PS27_9PROT|nr:DNA polymerase III subunit delta' [Telmatospirillum siberiense]PKU23208.1 DNA polymerase III subunit delta' [Telmatospirillum siberiense]